MEKCDNCNQKHTDMVSGIVNDIYCRNLCQDCLLGASQVSSGEARWSRSLDAEDQEAALQQPWNADGSINTRFAKLYPEQAKALFSQEDLRKASR